MPALFRPIQSPTLRSERQLPGYSYREYAPSGHLSAHVACYWTVDFDGRAGSQPHRIIPDGCVDIIVDRRATACRGAAFVAGLMTSYQVLDLEGEQSSFGIRMFSHSARTILRTPISEFGDGHVCLEDIWGTEGAYMAERLLLADGVGGMIALAESRLIDMLGRLDVPSPGLIHHGLQYMYDAGGILTPSGLADKLSFSERHLRRSFERELGIAPKAMLGIIRFQSLLGELAASGQSTGASHSELAARYGFYDQSHFIATFKRYYGMTPKQALIAFHPL
ncbi:MAG: hypothetical protein K0Q63_3332 [Paenibacillus sp.]|jgi:AraC-like DNA-binding protein|nr:hypothetical protein [Paenibacillus sp.]